MFRLRGARKQQHSKRASQVTAAMGNNTSTNKKAKAVQAALEGAVPSIVPHSFKLSSNRHHAYGPCEEPFADKDSKRTDILVHRGGTSRSLLDVLQDHQKVVTGEQTAKPPTAVSVQTIDVYRDFNAEKLDLPGGFQLLSMVPRRRFSRMRNLPADGWRHRAHERADALVYTIDMEGKTEPEYYKSHSWEGGYGQALWEGDRYAIASLLREPGMAKQPNKPFLLLVQEDNLTQDFDMERLVNLLGLGRIHRPFRAATYSTDPAGNGRALAEAFAWIASSAGDEGTAATECETDDDASILTSTTTVSGDTMMMLSADPYILDYEPTLRGGNSTLQRFQPLQKNTPCPFARAAKLWGGKSVCDEEMAGEKHVPYKKRVEHAAALNAGPLAEFVSQVVDEGEPLDGFCLEIPDAEYESGDKLGEKVGRLLAKLAELDPSPGENAMKMGPCDRPEWRFRFAGEDFFITTFSPRYPQDSSRQTFGATKAFMLFQPMTSFGRHGLTEDTPASATNWKAPTTLRDKARVAFRARGCPYHIPEELPYPVAEHIVKPIPDDGSSCVKWWEAPVAIDEGDEEGDY